MVIVLGCALAIACGSSSRASPPPSTASGPPPTLSLDEAIDERLVAIRPRGAGVHRVQLEVSAHADLVLVIPAGTFFRGAPDGEFQNMIVTETVSARLRAGQSHQLVVPTACTNFHRRAPHDRDRFVLATAEPALHRLVTCLEEHDVDDAKKQTLVWLLTDGIERDDLIRRKEMLQPRLVTACTKRLRQSAPRCQALVDATYDAVVDKLLEQARDYDSCAASPSLKKRISALENG